MSDPVPTVAVFGASGLIGQAVARDVGRAGFRVVPIARRFTAAGARNFGDAAVEAPFVTLDPMALGGLLAERGVDIVVNCVGVLQDSHRGRSDVVHCGFVARLVEALSGQDGARLLIHLSIAGRPEADDTAFSRTKRAGEALIISSGLPFVILRPGLVVAEAAYGGSALVRSLATVPFALPTREAGRPFATTAISDITRTIAVVASRWRSGERQWNAVWDVMERDPSTVGDVIESFRGWIGGPKPVVRLPGWLMDAGARAGDCAARLGWRPPVRNTALREMRRGVSGDPAPWAQATGIEPASCEEALARIVPSVQELWFGRLYLLKPLIVGGLSIFWIASGLISLIAAFDTATAILTDHGFPEPLALAVTAVTSLCDIGIGVAITARWTGRPGLLAGIGLSLFYMVCAAVITPEMWIEPLGALVKTGPAIVLMLVALAILDDR